MKTKHVGISPKKSTMKQKLAKLGMTLHHGTGHVSFTQNPFSNPQMQLQKKDSLFSEPVSKDVDEYPIPTDLNQNSLSQKPVAKKN